MCDRKKTCVNCGSNTHISNTCTEPTTSYGLININMIDELKEYKNELKMIFNNDQLPVDIMTFDSSDEELRDNEKYDEIYNNVKKSLLFLLVSRKHSLGYIEFIRGRYEMEDVKSIKYLFDQMTETEISNIRKLSFDILWCRLWKKNAKKHTFDKEYTVSIEKFTFVKKNYNLSEFLPLYSVSEWGFPKGRRNNGETNLKCAVRECCEETSLLQSELNILSSVKPIVENIIGTNNIQYKHVYYISIVDNIRKLNVINEPNQFVEIDTIGWFKKERVDNLIRPYHKEKLNIINKIINFLTYAIYCSKTHYSK